MVGDVLEPGEVELAERGDSAQGRRDHELLPAGGRADIPQGRRAGLPADANGDQR